MRFIMILLILALTACSGEKGIEGCWMTHTSGGSSQIDMDEKGEGYLTYEDTKNTFSDVIYTGDSLEFTVNWEGSDFQTHFRFDTVSPTQMSGVTWADGSSEQAVTADRTC